MEKNCTSKAKTNNSSCVCMPYRDRAVNVDEGQKKE